MCGPESSFEISHNTNQIKSPKGPSKFHHHKLISLPTKNHRNKVQKELKKEENPPPLRPPPPLISEVLFSESSMAASISVNGFTGGWSSVYRGSRGTSMWGEDYATSAPTQVRVGKKPTRLVPMMKNVNEGKGVFAPIVVVTRNLIGRKRFNQLRGKAIALHSQVITEFCKTIGADAKQRQGLIRLAKKNGERLGFLA
ncbi:protein PROTON GRADIENT REGULATION 5, chloroplastic-like [Rhododendron vialii]|uniref:protein PROTON GRADIENT REGULATION 5, chloroplastic-like n=1 Tax=Rhododendron vialii TaxID=182163 RepID=UPI00265FB027|nr:protein PROTON GRADIENT REGULATION 5, chloroplastic-like [Rhododendron vialii]